MTSPEGATVTLRHMLLAQGVPNREIDRAQREGRLEMLAIDHLILPVPPRYDIDEVAKRAGLPPETVTRLWRSLGFPDAGAGDVVFNDDDLRMLGLVVDLLEAGVLSEAAVFQMTRVIGSATARIAAAQVDLIRYEIGEDEQPPMSDADEPIEVQGAAVLTLMPQVMEYTWRRHLQASARRSVMDRATGDSAGMAVGFADLVGFTAWSQRASEQELAETVYRFESLAYETVASRGGRVVKMIGDEVMFTASEPKAAAEIALTLAETYRDDDELSDVRVGIAFGEVLTIEGDCFGPVVNLASRLVEIAYPGSVVIGQTMHDALADDDELELRWMRPRYLRHIGRVRLWVIRRAGAAENGEDNSYRERTRARRRAVRDAIVERLVDRGDDDALEARISALLGEDDGGQGAPGDGDS